MYAIVSRAIRLRNVTMKKFFAPLLVVLLCVAGSSHADYWDDYAYSVNTPTYHQSQANYYQGLLNNGSLNLEQQTAAQNALTYHQGMASGSTGYGEYGAGVAMYESGEWSSAQFNEYSALHNSGGYTGSLSGAARNQGIITSSQANQVNQLTGAVQSGDSAAIIGFGVSLLGSASSGDLGLPPPFSGQSGSNLNTGVLDDLLNGIIGSLGGGSGASVPAIGEPEQRPAPTRAAGGSVAPVSPQLQGVGIDTTFGGMAVPTMSDADVQRANAHYNAISQPKISDQFTENGDVDVDQLAHYYAGPALVGRDQYLENYFNSDQAQVFFEEHMQGTPMYNFLLTQALASPQTAAVYQAMLSDGQERYGDFQNRALALTTPVQREALTQASRYCSEQLAAAGEGYDSQVAIDCLESSYTVGDDGNLVDNSKSIAAGVGVQAASAVMNSKLHGYLTLRNLCGVYNPSYGGYVNDNSGGAAFQRCWWVDLVSERNFCLDGQGASCYVQATPAPRPWMTVLGRAAQTAGFLVTGVADQSLQVMQELRRPYRITVGDDKLTAYQVVLLAEQALFELRLNQGGQNAIGNVHPMAQSLAQAASAVDLTSGDDFYDAQLFRQNTGCSLDNVGGLHGQFIGFLEGMAGDQVAFPSGVGELSIPAPQDRADKLIDMAVACAYNRPGGSLAYTEIFAEGSNISEQLAPHIERIAYAATLDVLRHVRQQLRSALREHQTAGAIFTGPEYADFNYQYQSAQPAPAEVLRAIELEIERVDEYVSQLKMMAEQARQNATTSAGDV